VVDKPLIAGDTPPVEVPPSRIYKGHKKIWPE
jgi:hypothetical protein